ncbi:ATPase [Acidianus brierleyi]|uniref:ATPase n=1 Tax=Acidianus brierleyi TaxID=41673 RepID=A0A2U9IEY7_9CREN|nr:ATPase [Acidianus brierleyi]AWR94602.1 ATPase [Acidianus brierleyi]
MKILVNGLLTFDSGKTTFASYILSELKNTGLNFFPLKPIAGHNGWYSYETLLKSKSINALAGNDALKYYNITGIDVRLINPFAVLLFPVDLEKLDYKISFYEQLMENGYPVMIRYTDVNGNDYYYAVDPGLVIDSLSDILEDLYNTFKPIIVSNRCIRNKVNESSYIVDNNVKEFLKKDNIIIESYNDALAPTYSSLGVDVMFAVAPGKVFMIDGDRLRKILSLFTLPPWIIRTKEIFEYTKPDKTFVINIKNSKNDIIVNELLRYVDL